MHEETIRPFKGNRLLAGIRSYGDLLAAEDTIQCPRLKAAVRNKIQSIDNIRASASQNVIYALKGRKEYTFAPTYKMVTQNIIYRELIQFQSTDHAYQIKWVDEEEGRLPNLIDWD